MTKPAKPGSLLDSVQTTIKNVPGYECLDELLFHIPEGERADYLVYDRRMIIEQKEQIETSELRAKGRKIQDYNLQLETKYSMNMMNIVMTIPSVLTREERRVILKLSEDFYSRQNKNSHKADNQIASTKNILGLPDAVGALLLIFDHVSGMMPPIIVQRAHRDLAALANGKPKFKHIDMVVFSCHMKDITVYGTDHFRGYLLRDENNEEHKRMVLGILDALKGGADKPSLRINARGFDPYSVQVHRQDIFAGPVGKPVRPTE